MKSAAVSEDGVTIASTWAALCSMSSLPKTGKYSCSTSKSSATEQTFAIRRAVAAALDELQKEQPGITSVVTNVKDAQDILQYTQVLMAPGLVINGKLVYLCLGRIPKKEQVSGWLREALNL